MYDYIITKPPLDEDTLAHYGVKGMKWRKRKNRSKEKFKRYTRLFPVDKENLGEYYRDRSRKDTVRKTSNTGESWITTRGFKKGENNLIAVYTHSITGKDDEPKRLSTKKTTKKKRSSK